jgi:putative sterol carrier protein
MPWFPTVEWYEKYRENLNDNPRFRRLIDDWGEEFKGDFVFEINEVPVNDHRLEDIPDEMLGVDKMPDDIWDDLPDALEDEIKRHGVDKPIYRSFSLLDQSVRDALSDELRALLEESEALFEANPTYLEAVDEMSEELRDFLPPHLDGLVHQLENFVNEDGDAFAYLNIEDGRVTEARALEPQEADDVDAAFHLYGDYEDWEYFMKSDETVIGVVMDEVLKPEGRMLTLMKYADALNEMGEMRHDIETQYIFDVAQEKKVA